MKKELTFTLQELKEIRKALALAIEKIDDIEEEERFYLLDELHDRVEEAEEELEEN